jgi:hypothetical protein
MVLKIETKWGVMHKGNLVPRAASSLWCSGFCLESHSIISDDGNLNVFCTGVWCEEDGGSLSGSGAGGNA